MPREPGPPKWVRLIIHYMPTLSGRLSREVSPNGTSIPLVLCFLFVFVCVVHRIPEDTSTDTSSNNGYYFIIYNKGILKTICPNIVVYAYTYRTKPAGVRGCSHSFRYPAVNFPCDFLINITVFLCIKVRDLGHSL